MKSRIVVITCILFLLVLTVACNKNRFLNTRPDESEVVPNKLSDFQAMLDYDAAMNGYGSGLVPALGVVGSDDYYLLEKYYNLYLTQSDKNEYVWDKNPYPGQSLKDWDYSYLAVIYCNIALEGTNNIKPSANEVDEYNNIVGSALFFRAYVFYQLAQVFAQPYDSSTAASDLGIPLRLSSEIIQPNKRASVEDTYEKIIEDLKKASELLPTIPKYKTRPSKPAAYALLARVYLIMGAYQNARLYADSCLSLYNTLIDYNTLDSTSNNPFQPLNDEVIFQCAISNWHNDIATGIYRIDSLLYASYENNDLRRVIFYSISGGLPNYKGSYTGTLARYFGGIATDEIYLIRSECNARLSDIPEAMKDLNTLLKTRWKTGTFIPLTADNPDQALRDVLTERRKELVMRASRWSDLRRLNKDPRFKKTLVRIIENQTYTLPPNDPRYTWPIPDDVLSFNPDMKQNPR